MTYETKHTVITSIGGAIAVAGMFVFHLVSEPWGWALASIGMMVFIVPFVVLWRDMWRQLRAMRRKR